MNLDWKAIVLLAAIRRQNPTLKPRWSCAAAAVRLALKVGPADKGFDRALACIALDVRSYGFVTGAMRAVAEKAVLEMFEPESRRIGQLMSVLFFSLGAAIDVALSQNEAAAWQHFAAALDAEIAPDKGEVWAAIKGLPVPGRDLDTLRRYYPWLFEDDAELMAAANEAIATETVTT
jgi:hypothetical protein